jgi:hypothetical protein
MSMMKLRLGPLLAEGSVISRSGVRFLLPPGHLCQPNDVVGYCNISVERRHGATRTGASPFEGERLQVAFATRFAGRFTPAPSLAPGGYLNILAVQPWDPQTVLGCLECSATQPAFADMRLLLLAGQRMTELADEHGGLLPGWHRRKRAWWYEPPGAFTTLLSLGICDATGAVVGEGGAFLDMFQSIMNSTQMILLPDRPVVPCAPVLLDQFRRSDADRRDIAADLWRGLHETKITPTADDFLFGGGLLTALERAPMHEAHPLLTPHGVQTAGPADWIVLSLNSEPSAILRHKRLGYWLYILPFLRRAAGPAIRAWLASAFEPVRRSVTDIRQDYAKLIDAVAEGTGGRFLILNRMSTSGQEDIANYAPFDVAMGETLANIASKELNIMLDDLAAERDVAIIDVDAIAAQLGGAMHLPDGMHQSAALQQAVRAEISYAIGSRTMVLN